MRCWITLSVVLVSALPAFSAPIATNAVVLCTPGPSCQSLGTQPTTLNYSNTVMNGSNSISIIGFADENLTTGALKASESYTEPSQESFYTQLNTVAQLRDTFTIDAPGLFGTVGYLEIPFLVTGTTSPNGQGQISTFLSDPAGVNTPGCPTCFFAGNTSLVTSPMSFHFGTPFNLFWALAAVTYPSAAVTGFSDYSNTATLQGFEVFNSDHQLISNETLTAPGGEQIALITSPEPSSLLLVGLSLSFLVVAFRYRS